MAKKNSSGGKSLAAHHGNERADSEMRVKAGSKAPSTMSVAPPSEAAEDETYQLSGDFEKDFCELCQRNSVSPIKVVPRPHRPSSPQISHPETSISKGGKESKEDRNRSHLNPPPEPTKQSEDKDQEPLPTTYVTKEKFDYFQPRIEIESEEEGSKSHLKDLFIRGWKVDAKVMEVFSMILPKQEKLVSINLWNAGLIDETLETLAKIVVQCNSLKDLCLDGNAYIRQHRYDLFLKEESSVQNLSLKNCYVNDIGAQNIGEALATNKNLLTLNLCFNKITCVGAQHIATGLRMNRTLLSLNLGSNLIENAGCCKLAESLHRFALTHKEVVERRLLLSKKAADEPSSSSRLGPVTSNQRPPSVKSGGHLKEEKKKKETLKKKDTQLKTQKEASGKKSSAVDLPPKTSKSPKKAEKAAKEKKGHSQSEQETPEQYEFPHPLLETAEELEGGLWIPGNRSLINLNLARNKIGIDGVKEFLQTVQFQSSVAVQSTKTAGVGLLRLSLQRNSFSAADSAYIQLNDIMLTKDPFYKPPSSLSPTSEAAKEDN